MSANAYREISLLDWMFSTPIALSSCGMILKIVYQMTRFESIFDSFRVTSERLFKPALLKLSSAQDAETFGGRQVEALEVFTKFGFLWSHHPMRGNGAGGISWLS